MIDEPPALPKEPPPTVGAEVRPMSIAAATAWTSGIVLVFLMLVTLIGPHNGTYTANDLIGNMACQAIAYLLGLFLILRAHAPDASIRDFIGVRRTHFGFYPLALLLGVAVQVPVQSLYTVISRRWPSASDSEDRLVRMFTESGSAKRVALCALIVFLGPLIEEIFFRGALFRPLLKRYPSVIVVTITSIFFAVSHVMPQMFIPIALVGAAMGYLRAKSGSLATSLLFHATFNAFPFYALATSAPGASDAQDELMPPPWLTAVSSLAVVALLGLVYLLGSRSSVATRARDGDLR